MTELKKEDEGEHNIFLRFWCMYPFQTSEAIVVGGGRVWATTPCLPHICQDLPGFQVSETASFLCGLHDEYESSKCLAFSGQGRSLLANSHQSSVSPALRWDSLRWKDEKMILSPVSIFHIVNNETPASSPGSAPTQNWMQWQHITQWSRERTTPGYHSQSPNKVNHPLLRWEGIEMERYADECDVCIVGGGPAGIFLWDRKYLGHGRKLSGWPMLTFQVCPPP